MSRRSPGFLALIVTIAAAAAAAAAAATVSTASAADLPAAAPAPGYYPPAYEPALYNWTGFYFGGQVGLNLLEDTVTDTSTTALLTNGTQTRLSSDGLVYGGQLGANYEIAPWVIGVEGTWAGSNISASSTTASVVPTVSVRSSAAESWYATATGRIGYAANTLLIYGKGGAAWMYARYTQDSLVSGVVNSEQIIGDTRMGFTVGGGLEYGMTEHLSARFEYDFLDFGSRNYTFAALKVVGVATPLPVSISAYTHIFTVGLNFRFD